MSDEFTNRIVGRLEVEHCDALAVAKNAATNGRLFSVMLFAANLASFIDGRGRVHWHLALAAAAIVGISHLAEVVPMPLWCRALAPIAVIALASSVFVLSLIR